MFIHFKRDFSCFLISQNFHKFNQKNLDLSRKSSIFFLIFQNKPCLLFQYSKDAIQWTLSIFLSLFNPGLSTQLGFQVRGCNFYCKNMLKTVIFKHFFISLVLRLPFNPLQLHHCSDCFLQRLLKTLLTMFQISFFVCNYITGIQNTNSNFNDSF